MNAETLIMPTSKTLEKWVLTYKTREYFVVERFLVDIISMAFGLSSVSFLVFVSKPATSLMVESLCCLEHKRWICRKSRAPKYRYVFCRFVVVGITENGWSVQGNCIRRLL